MNGRIYSSEIARGLDVLKLDPDDQLSAAEIAAAESVMREEINPQLQTRVTWADTPDVAQAYLDQLNRTEAFDDGLAGRIGTAIDGWRSGRAASDSALVTSLDDAATSATGADKARLQALSALFGRQAA